MRLARDAAAIVAITMLVIVAALPVMFILGLTAWDAWKVSRMRRAPATYGGENDDD